MVVVHPIQLSVLLSHLLLAAEGSLLEEGGLSSLFTSAGGLPCALPNRIFKVDLEYQLLGPVPVSSSPFPQQSNFF